MTKSSTTLADHPIAEIFPLLDGADFLALVKSISKHGLKVPIMRYEDKILDGRNRYRACLEAGVEPRFVEYFGNSPVQDVVSWNLERRQLTPSQAACCALAMLPKLEAEAKARQAHGKTAPGKTLVEQVPEAFRARDEAGRAFGVSGRYVSEAEMVRASDPELFEQCKAGEKTISEAKREIQRVEHAKKVEIAKASPKKPRSESHSIILADPPWRFDGTWLESRVVANHYPTLSLAEIIEHAPKSAADDSILFLWSPAPKFEEALRVLSAWGFRYKTHAVWNKETIGQGFWFRYQHELLLVGIKGTPGMVPESARVSSIFSEPRGEHSAKPQCVYEWLEHAFPLEPKLEMYARAQRPGWDAWGNEV